MSSQCILFWEIESYCELPKHYNFKGMIVIHLEFDKKVSLWNMSMLVKILLLIHTASAWWSWRTWWQSVTRWTRWSGWARWARWCWWHWKKLALLELLILNALSDITHSSYIYPKHHSHQIYV